MMMKAWEIKPAGKIESHYQFHPLPYTFMKGTTTPKLKNSKTGSNFP